MKKISFIIPVYNVEDYLEECFRSIYSQTDSDCEIILVDDGSTDSSCMICDKLSEISEDVIVIHKKNEGLASARNTGLNVAKGRYVAFVDSDDKIAPNSVKKILKRIDDSNVDIFFMKAYKFYPDGREFDIGDCIEEIHFLNKKKEDILLYLSNRPKFPGSSCTKIFRRSFLDSNELRFPHNNIQAEDLGFVRDCIMYAESLCAIDIPYYMYRQLRTGSITQGSKEKALKGILYFVSETISKYSKNKKPIEPYGKYALSFAAYEYYIGLLCYSGIQEKQRKLEFYEELKKEKWIIDYTYSRRFYFLKILVRYFGIKVSSFGIRLVHRLRTLKYRKI